MVRAHQSVTKWFLGRHTALTFTDVRTCSGNAEQNNGDHINFFPTDRLINLINDFSLRVTFKDVLCEIAC